LLAHRRSRREFAGDSLELAEIARLLWAAQGITNPLGHAAQNVYLVAESLGIGTVMVGAFDDERMKRAIPLGADENPLALLPLGRYG
jgi:nitroreductase